VTVPPVLYQLYTAKTLYFQTVHPSTSRLAPIWHDTMPQIFNVRLGIAKKVFKVRGQMSRSISRPIKL